MTLQQLNRLHYEWQDPAQSLRNKTEDLSQLSDRNHINDVTSTQTCVKKRAPGTSVSTFKQLLYDI